MGQSLENVLNTFPLAPEFVFFFGNAETSRLLQSHASTHTQDGVHDIHETSTWKEWFSPGGMFRGDPRGLALGLCADGTNPFS